MKNYTINSILKINKNEFNMGLRSKNYDCSSLNRLINYKDKNQK